MRAESGSLVRNMSAPPRTTVTYAALAPASTDADGSGGDAGLSFVCRLDFRSLLPGSRQQSCPEHFYAARPEQVHRRLRLAYVYTLAEVAGKPRAPDGALARAMRTPLEQVADELGDLLATENLLGKDLPRVGLLLPAYGTGRAVMSGMRRTLAVLARRRGTVFLRDADPIVWAAAESNVADLWMPRHPPTRPA